MSSQTQPQNVHVAFLTMLRLILSLASLGLGSARTGRHNERSAKLPAAEASADAAWHVPSRFDQLPGWGIFSRGFRESPADRRFLEGSSLINSHSFRFL